MSASSLAVCGRGYQYTRLYGRIVLAQLVIRLLGISASSLAVCARGYQYTRLYDSIILS